MKLLTFKGGVHPPEYKELTCHKPVEVFPVPERIFVPLSQHTGAPAKPVVNKGDEVKRGQLIAEPSAFISAGIHSPVAGVVKGIADYPHPFGNLQPAVEIEPKEEQELDSGLEPIKNFENAEPEVLKERVKQTGIVGMGGATFPTYVKLSPPPDKKIDSVIINGAECEPYITADHRLMLEAPEKIIGGLKIIMRILGVKRAYLGIEANKPDAIVKLEKLIEEVPGAEVVVLKTKYPQGAEKQLIKAILNREVPSGGLPMDVGALVQNVGTTCAIYEAVVLGKPLIERIVTVTGSGISEPKNLYVPIGTPIQNLIEFCGGFAKRPGKVILGGPMMGLAQSDLKVPVIKGTNAVLVLGDDELDLTPAGPCIRCGRCARACPMGLVPSLIGSFVRRDRIEEAGELNVMDCMECGSCAYVCPAHIPLVQLFRYAKSEIVKKRKKEQAKKEEKK